MRSSASRIVLFLSILISASATARAALLPERIDPPSPFPSILAQAPTIENIAPGIDYGNYALLTSIGLITIHVIAIQPRHADVRIANVLAANALDSRGETVGSMAKRTRAVAGINGDYFDIGNTNRPENIVVRDGTLLQVPSKRYALAVMRDGSSRIAEFSFEGTFDAGGRTFPLEAIDDLPAPGGGLVLITPQFGPVAPQENVTLVTLAPLEASPPLERYRVIGVADNGTTQPPGYYAAIGPNIYSAVDAFTAGDVVQAQGTLSPVDLNAIEAAIGGGPLILHNGSWYDDPDGPNGHEYAKRIPCSGVAIAPDGRLLLIEVDGRQPELSVGLRRQEFAALMRALGATEGMALDGGGSSTIVVRRLGESETAVVNSPSDRIERPVGDGLFVYSTAPFGPAVRLVARPGVIRAVSGAEVPLRIAAVDSANHVTAGTANLSVRVTPPSLGSVRDGDFVAARPGIGALALAGDGLHGQVPIEVSGSPAMTTISPLRPNVENGATIQLAARAFDPRGYPLDIPALLPWHASSGSIDSRGAFRAGNDNASISVRIGSAVASARVTVGSHDVALGFAQVAHFVSIPRGGQGSVSRGAGCGSCAALSFSFSGNERAAYAMADLPLPDGTIGVTFDVLDDGSAARLRVALRNEINESVLLDATQLGATGWRTVTVRFPTDVTATRLIAIYALPSKGIELSQGSVVVRNVRAIVAGR